MNRRLNKHYKELLSGDLSLEQIQYLINHQHIVTQVVQHSIPDEFIEPLVNVIKAFWEKVLVEYDIVVECTITDWEDTEICIYNRSVISGGG